MTENQLKRLEELTGTLLHGSITKSEFSEYQYLKTIMLNKHKIDQADHFKKHIFRR